MADRNTVMNLLRDFGIKKVTVRYSGGGDSGQIDEVVFEPSLSPEAEAATVDAEKTVGRHEGGIWIDTVRACKATIQETVEEYCDDQIDSLHGGYENSEGGFGEFIIDVDKDTIVYTHNDYVIETNTSEYKL